MYRKSYFKKTSNSLFLIMIYLSSAMAVGSGGILNRVPQAHVWLEKNGDRQHMNAWQVYVHPFEGSLVIMLNDSSSCIALDKNKKHAIEMKVADIKILDSGNMIDVPEKTPYRILKNRPHFNRTHATLVLDDGQLLIITVER